VDEGAW